MKNSRIEIAVPGKPHNAVAEAIGYRKGKPDLKNNNNLKHAQEATSNLRFLLERNCLPTEKK